MHDLHVWPDVEADGSHPSKTPGKTSDPEDKMSSLAKVCRFSILVSQACNSAYTVYSVM
jgi:hypothetical protein